MYYPQCEYNKALINNKICQSVHLLGGQVQVYFTGMIETIEDVRTGKVRPLAVTASTRAKALPDVPPSPFELRLQEYR
jgi:hypothetical protein